MNKEDIKQLRTDLGLSQQAFAVRIGTTLHTVSGWELGKHKPYPLAMEKLEQLKQEVQSR